MPERPRLTVTRLEGRTAPAVHTWDGGGATPNWSEAANWAGDVAPAAGEADVVIVYTTPETSTTQDIAGLAVQTLRFDPGSAVTLTLAANLSIEGAGGITDANGRNSIVGAGDLVLTGGTVFVDTASATGQLTLDIDITGANGLFKEGVGTLVLSTPGANTFTGPTTVGEGTLRLSTTTADSGLSPVVFVGDGSGAARSARLELVGSSELPDPVAVTVRSDGLLAVGAGTQELTTLTLTDGRVEVAAGGVLRVRAGGAVTADGTAATITAARIFPTGGGALDLPTATTFAVAGGGQTGTGLLVDAAITGAGGVVKAGPGLLTLDGYNTYTGPTVVNAGNLYVAFTVGAMGAGPVTVAGGTVGGDGLAGPLTMTAGTLAPGLGQSVPVTLRTGDLVLSGGTYVNRAFANSNGDSLLVEGTVTLSGAALGPSFVGVPSSGQGFELIYNDGTDPVSGTFLNLPEGGQVTVGGRTYRITYVGGDGNDVGLSPGTAPVNTPPTVSDVADRTILPGASTGAVPFTVGDAQTPAGDLRVTAASSDTTLVPESGLVLGGSGANRTVTVTPAAGRTGAATVTLTVTDAGGGQATESFVITVTGTTPPPAGTTLFLIGGPTGGTAASVTGAGIAAAAVSFPGIAGVARVATADVTGDGVADLVGGAGPGSTSRVVVLDGATGGTVAAFDVFEATFTGGVYVAAADLTGDGRAEVVVTPDRGGGPVVVVYDGAELAAGLTGEAAQLARFFGIVDANFRGGARPALGDVSGDGTPDLLVAAGLGGGPRVAVFDGTSVTRRDTYGSEVYEIVRDHKGFPIALSTSLPRKLVGDFFVFEPTLRNGVFVAAGDLTGDGAAEVIVGGGPGGGPRVFALDGRALVAGTPTPVANFFAGDSASRGGVRVAVVPDATGRPQLVTGSGDGEAARVRVYQPATARAGGTPDQELAPFGGAVLADGVYVG